MAQSLMRSHPGAVLCVPLRSVSSLGRRCRQRSRPNWHSYATAFPSIIPRMGKIDRQKLITAYRTQPNTGE